MGTMAIQMVHMQNYHVDQRHSKSKNCTFISESIGCTLMFEHLQSFGSVVEIFLFDKVKHIIAETTTHHLAYAFVIDDDITRVESIMHSFIPTKMRHHQHATAQNRHHLLICKRFAGGYAVLNLVFEGVWLIVKKFDQFVLARTDSTLRDDFIVEGVEIKLMRYGETGFASFGILAELILIGESVLNGEYKCVPSPVFHEHFPLALSLDNIIIFQLRFGVCGAMIGYYLTTAHGDL